MLRIIFGALIVVLCSNCLDDNDTPTPITFEEQLAIDVEAIDRFLAENNITASIHQSQIRFVTITEGTGDSPSADSNVRVKYKGTFLSGEEFDANDEGVDFQLNRLIPAWQIMIADMKEGGKITMYAPSVYCYGPTGAGSIPPNANLIFEVELIAIN